MYLCFILYDIDITCSVYNCTSLSQEESLSLPLRHHWMMARIAGSLIVAFVGVVSDGIHNLPNYINNALLE